MQQPDDTTSDTPAADEPTDPETRACMRWGITAMALGGVIFVILYTSVLVGGDVHPELARAMTTGAIGGLVTGLMGILAAKIMRHVDRVGAARTAAATRIEATQTLIAEELVKIHGVVVAIRSATSRSVDEWDEKIKELHAEINRDMAAALVEGLRANGKANVTELRSRQPRDI